MNVADRALTEWLLDSDPSIRWQVMGDLTDAPADEVAAGPAFNCGLRLLASARRTPIAG